VSVITAGDHGGPRAAGTVGQSQRGTSIGYLRSTAGHDRRSPPARRRPPRPGRSARVEAPANRPDDRDV